MSGTARIDFPALFEAFPAGRRVACRMFGSEGDE